MLVAGPFDQAGAGSASATVRGKAREDELEDMLATVSQTFLGVTLNCARCHDHKFDPYTARDYYRLKAVFDGVFAGDRPLLTRADLKACGGRGGPARPAARRSPVTDRRAGGGRRERVRKDRPPAVGATSDLPKPIARWSFEADGRDSVGGPDTPS